MRSTRVLLGMNKPTEAQVLRACLDLLALYPQVKAWRQNTGAVVSEYKGKRRFMRFGLPGQADITGILQEPEPRGRGAGIRLEIECKRPGGKQSEAQQEFQTMIQSMGGIYLLVDSADALAAALSEIGIRRGK